MQMTDFGSADLYNPANNWYSSQFSSIGNSFTGLNSNLTNLTGSPGHHQLNSLNPLHHSSTLDSTTNAVLHNSPSNSTSPQQAANHPTQQSNNGANSNQLTNLSNSNNLTTLTQATTQSNQQQLLSPIQASAVQTIAQSRSNSTSLNLSTSSNSTSTNGSNNALPSYSSQLGNSSSVAAHLHPAAAHHQFNIPSHLSVHSAQHPTHHSQFSPHSLSTHHSQHPLNHLTAHHHHFLNVSNNFFPGMHHSNAASSLNAAANPSAFTSPPSPSSPNNSSINSTTNAFTNLTFHRPDSASNAGSTNYDRMHTGYSLASGVADNSSLGRGYPSLIDHHSSRTSGLDTFVGLRHMPTLTNLTSNCNTGNSHLNNLDDTNVNSMFIAHHNQTLNQLNPSSLASHLQGNGSNGSSLVPLHGSTHNSVNSSSDSRHNGEDDLNLGCVKQEDDEDNKLNIANSQFPSTIADHTLPQYNWVKKSQHSSQHQAGNKR